MQHNYKEYIEKIKVNNNYLYKNHNTSINFINKDD